MKRKRFVVTFPETGVVAAVNHVKENQLLDPGEGAKPKVVPFVRIRKAFDIIGSFQMLGDCPFLSFPAQLKFEDSKEHADRTAGNV